MKTAVEIEDKLTEATKEYEDIPWWDTEEKSAAGGVVVALSWVLGLADELNLNEGEN